MNKLLAFLNSLTPDEQAAFAVRCDGTTVGYLRKAVSVRQQLREKLCILIEIESGRMVLCEDLRPDVNWKYLRDSGQFNTSAEDRFVEAAETPFADQKQPPSQQIRAATAIDAIARRTGT